MAAGFNDMIGYLKSTAAVAERIASGDLSVTPKPESDHDALNLALARMTEQLRGLVSQINDATSVVTRSSEQMASTSKETGRAVDEVASAINQVALGNERQAHSIADARRLADEVSGAAGSGAA